MEGQWRVQNLAEAGLAHLPPEFVQPPPLRVDPGGRTTPSFAGGIPLVNLDPATDPLPALRRACREWGVFHVVNHGVPLDLLDSMRRVGLAFFRSPKEAKDAYACDPRSAASEGYGSQMLPAAADGGGGSKRDWRDYFDHHMLPLARRNPERWPSSPHDYRDVVEKYSEEMKVLAQKFLGLISRSLDLPSSCMEEAVGEVYQNITISYYPPCPNPELALGLQAHSDFGAITLLIQDDVGGLEVLKDGKWVLVEPLSDAIVVILADQTQIITNGEYISGVHRAIVNGQRARLSVATFYDPAKTRKLSAVPQLLGGQSLPRYREVIYGDYVSSWYGKGPDGKRNLDNLLLHPE